MCVYTAVHRLEPLLQHCSERSSTHASVPLQSQGNCPGEGSSRPQEEGSHESEFYQSFDNIEFPATSFDRLSRIHNLQTISWCLILHHCQSIVTYSVSSTVQYTQCVCRSVFTDWPRVIGNYTDFWQLGVHVRTRTHSHTLGSAAVTDVN